MSHWSSKPLGSSLAVMALVGLSAACSSESKSPTKGGCQTDQECKGARICSESICVEPVSPDFQVAPMTPPTVVPSVGVEPSVNRVKAYRVAHLAFAKIRHDLTKWAKENPGCPASLEEAVTIPATGYTDPWGQPYVLRCTREGLDPDLKAVLGVFSIGPDGVEDTEDDLKTW